MAKRPRSGPQTGRQAGDRPTALVDAPSPRVEAAHRLWCAGSQADALALLEEAVREEPNNVRTYVMAARAYAEKFDFQSMERLHEKLLQRAPRHPGVHHYLGETYLALKLPDRAIACFGKAAGLPGGGPPTSLELAALYERAHRLDEAEALIERVIHAGYDRPLVALVRGRIQRRQHRHDEAEATFRALVERLPADSEWAGQAWGELATLKDEQGDFDGAIAAVEHAKSSQGQRADRHRAAAEKMEARMQETFATITSEHLRRWRERAAGLSPARVALLTGFPRSGTTLLEQLLDAHPHLVSSEERDFIGKELLWTFMAGHGRTPLLDVMDDRTAAEIDAQRRRYFQAMEYLLGEPIGGRMHLDKNPSYNLMIPLLVCLFPETRLIVALRDPRDVVLSCYLRYLPLNPVSVRFADVRQAADRYGLEMTAWLKLRELLDLPWCEVRYEDVVADAAGQARRALGTLGLPWDERVLSYRRRLADSKRVTSPSYEAVAEPIYTRAVGRWKNYAKLLEPAWETLEPFVHKFGYAS